jgi:acetate kinase
MEARILVLNGGSSSLTFALFDAGAPPPRAVSGRFERIGTAQAELIVAGGDGGADQRRSLTLPDHAACVPALLDLLARRGVTEPDAVGHRVVHGGTRFHAAVRVDASVLAELRRLAPFAPEHEPAEIALIEAFGARHPGVPQVACFDTAFHADLPRVAQLLPIPLRYNARGVRRYGFHGLSYSYATASCS